MQIGELLQRPKFQLPEGSRLVRNLKGEIEELKADIVEKESHLDHLQRTNDQLSNSLEEAKDAYVDGFKSSKDFKDVLDRHNTTSFEYFRQEAMKAFSNVDFSKIKLLEADDGSLLTKSLDGANEEDDAFDLPLVTFMGFVVLDHFIFW
nr:hypothetical protein CFP56_18238 [Quercus suber]